MIINSFYTTTHAKTIYEVKLEGLPYIHSMVSFDLRIIDTQYLDMHENEVSQYLLLIGIHDKFAPKIV